MADLITIDRAVVQQALSWILYTRRFLGIDEPKEERALRAALAQAEPVEEPVAWRVRRRSEKFWNVSQHKPLDAMQDDRFEVRALVEPVQYNNEPSDWLPKAEQQAEPVQEPFALPCPTPKACREHCCSGHCIPRATSPQQAEPVQDLIPPDSLFVCDQMGAHVTRVRLAQQAEPDHETRAELAEQQVVQLAEERDHYRRLWQKAQQAEPVEAAQKSGEFRVMVCGVDCHPGDQHCNGYCTGKTDDPPEATAEQQAEPVQRKPARWTEL